MVNLNARQYIILDALQPSWEDLHELILARQVCYGFADSFTAQGYRITMVLARVPSPNVMANLVSTPPYFVVVEEVDFNTAVWTSSALRARYRHSPEQWWNFEQDSDSESDS